MSVSAGSASTLANLVRHLAVRGQLDRAEPTARTVPDPRWQSTALAVLVPLIPPGPDAGCWPKPYRPANWHNCLPQLCRLAPAAVLALADEQLTAPADT